MATTVVSPTEICNLALDAVKYPDAIGDLYEGTLAARVALRFDSQTRDELLSESDWPFARQDAILQVLKTAPPGGYGIQAWTNAYPPLPWIYEYAFPANALEMRSVRPTPILLPEQDPHPNIFRVANDTASGNKVVLTNLANAIGIFTGQITAISQWDTLFVNALVRRLAEKFAPALSQIAGEEKAEAAQAALAMAEAEMHPG